MLHQHCMHEADAENEERADAPAGDSRTAPSALIGRRNASGYRWRARYFDLVALALDPRMLGENSPIHLTIAHC